MAVTPSRRGGNTNQPAQPPQPDQSYERADPAVESGMGDLGQPAFTPQASADPHQHPAHHRPADSLRPMPEHHAPPDRPPNNTPVVPEDKIEGDMTTEEPLGWDQAPTDIHDPTKKRHPRTEGKGGTPK